MLSLPPSVRIFVARRPVDMRRSFDGLSAVVIDVVEEDPQSGHVFAFEPGQLGLFSNEGLEEAAAEVAATLEGAPKRSRKPKGHGRAAFPAHLPRERVVCSVAEGERSCPDCGKQMQEIGTELTERGHFVPAHFVVRSFEREKLACPAGRAVVTAKAPEPLVRRCKYEASAYAHVAVSKYQDHVPLHRMQGILERQGAQLSKQTMWDMPRHRGRVGGAADPGGDARGTARGAGPAGERCVRGRAPERTRATSWVTRWGRRASRATRTPVGERNRTERGKRAAVRGVNGDVQGVGECCATAKRKLTCPEEGTCNSYPPAPQSEHLGVQVAVLHAGEDRRLSRSGRALVAGRAGASGSARSRGQEGNGGYVRTDIHPFHLSFPRALAP